MSDTGDWRPGADLDALRLRAMVNARIRQFFADRGVLEVETPVLGRAGTLDPNIDSLHLDAPGSESRGGGRRWLRTSPEFAMKRLLAAGVGDCYELARVFRAGESGRRHNPEFTLLEWYRVGWDHHRLAGEVVELLRGCLALVGIEAPARTMSYRELFGKHAQVDPFVDAEDALRHALRGHDVPEGLDRDGWLDLILTHRIQPSLAAGALTVVHGYPPSQAALARVVGEGAHAHAARFEVYLGPLELANGYHELIDVHEQRARFERERALRFARGDDAPPLDERLLAAMSHGLPACAGVALGVDRLLMAMLGRDDIDAVIAFTAARA